MAKEIACGSAPTLTPEEGRHGDIASFTPSCAAPIGWTLSVHPPVHLRALPDADRRSRLVFIVQDIEPEAIKASLAACLAAADGPRRSS